MASGKFVMNRDYTVRTLSGHVIEFKRGISKYVPPGARAEAMQFGAIPEEEDSVVPPDAPPVKRDGPLGDERAQLIRMQIEDMVARNTRGDFTPGGKPDLKALKKALGFDVDGAERDLAWAQFQADAAKE